MIHTYEDALEWIHSRLRLGIKPGLKRMEWMMSRLGNPEQKIKGIHVAGTNGKGSTVCYVRNILEQAGYSVGTFTSPYFEIFNERISVNGIPIYNQEIIELVNVIKPLAEELEATDLGGPSEFEVITAMAFYYFDKNKTIDLVIFETGLGGRLDSTNIIVPMVSVITNIGYDHMDFLGETLGEIAFEKAGIIKPRIPVITSVEQKEALEVIVERSHELASQSYIMGVDYFIASHQSTELGEQFSVRTSKQQYDQLEITMKGAHQVKNASLAVKVIEYLAENNHIQVTEEAIRDGLKQSIWIGRFEQVSFNPPIILDGAHNPEGVRSLIQTVQVHLQNKKVHIIFSAMKDKKLEEMIELLITIAASITFTSFDFPRVSSAKALYDLSTNTHILRNYNEVWKEAIDQKVSELTENEVLIVTGSLYFLSEVRPYILEKFC
ncbi:bifunctional folylpolyglutamate synthase/dihydrofolate synthase [Bacillus sp. PS06]|uniref:bifunctional folylpolyglutamate synthase/dihydrofolate synthase n=1 Tax=Bacillus sp. PS06 TaxID=2764176 RepID=UPI00178375AC|nr:folylpolyglutamate synthase/dihydrofolate synthase family protein [Bacillus sp. PS06]MBD8068860.1 bifunctional folylpolyglutamate synthase/dihydrofolate synthase [Bacillus sp. PS06]